VFKSHRGDYEVGLQGKKITTSCCRGSWRIVRGMSNSSGAFGGEEEEEGRRTQGRTQYISLKKGRPEGERVKDEVRKEDAGIAMRIEI